MMKHRSFSHGDRGYARPMPQTPAGTLGEGDDAATRPDMRHAGVLAIALHKDADSAVIADAEGDTVLTQKKLDGRHWSDAAGRRLNLTSVV